MQPMPNIELRIIGNFFFYLFTDIICLTSEKNQNEVFELIQITSYVSDTDVKLRKHHHRQILHRHESLNPHVACFKASHS